jgi:hypothetical protein
VAIDILWEPFDIVFKNVAFTKHRTSVVTEGEAALTPAAKRSRTNDDGNPAVDPYHHQQRHPQQQPPPPPPQQQQHYVPPPTSPSARLAFPSLARLPTLPSSAAAGVNPAPPPQPPNAGKKGDGNEWQHKALWLERRAQIERAQRAAGAGARAGHAGAAADDSMDVVDGGIVTAAAAGTGVSGTSEAWAPLPPRQRGARRRPRGLSVEMR